MNVEQINERVTKEADARVDETIERLFHLLELQETYQKPLIRCYCHELDGKLCEICKYG